MRECDTCKYRRRNVLDAPCLECISGYFLGGRVVFSMWKPRLIDKIKAWFKGGDSHE